MPKSGLDTKLVQDLAQILNDSELTEIEVEHEGTKIRVTKQVNAVAAPAAYIPSAAPVAAPAAPAASAPATAPAAQTVSGNPVTSPMVGTTYLAAEPGAKPFVKVGDTVSVGQQLFIIEAMKTMNAVNSTVAGTIKQILISDAQPVEFGEVLCIIE